MFSKERITGGMGYDNSTDWDSGRHYGLPGGHGICRVFILAKGAGGSADEFYLGGRKLGPLVTAMSAEASDMSSWLLMGLPGVAYLTGIADAGWTAIGLAVGTYLNWLIVAKRLRRYSGGLRGHYHTGLFSRRYEDKKNILMCIAAIGDSHFLYSLYSFGFQGGGDAV